MEQPTSHASIAADALEQVARASQMSSFVRYCELHTAEQFADHAAFHEFSVSQRDRFWGLFLDWSQLACNGSPEPVCTSEQCETALFFPNLRLNYAENLLRCEPELDGDQGALIAYRPYSEPLRLTRGELRSRVHRLARHLLELGIRPGDRVAAVAGNNA